MSGEKAGFRAKLTNIFLEPRELREYQSEHEPDFELRSGNKANELAHFAGGGTIALGMMALGSMLDKRGITAPNGYEIQAAYNGLLETGGMMCTGFLWMIQDLLSGRNSTLINSMKTEINNPDPRQNKV